MDRLRKHGEAELEKEQVFDQSSHSSLIPILHVVPASGSSQNHHVKLHRERTPALRLIPGILNSNASILRHCPNRQRIVRRTAYAQKTFHLLFHGFHLDPYTLSIPRRESYGFATFKTNEDTVTSCLATISAFSIWSHSSSTSRTQGIIIPRVSDSVHDRDGTLGAYFLRYVAIVEAARWIDRIYEKPLHGLRDAERSTGEDSVAGDTHDFQVFNLTNQSAAATKQDSVSMKVLAVMNLVFLPGAFFATPFSIPSLY
ncbi:hypothetical protein B0T14DRAFT_498932 [Immersiella caudata]|uniref:Uncharacterized protein n=1 Tax=Immersiella caudata TaxID=314043 RepID=A0AA39WDL8_9PEZI|nr:hypothetical protein B0T14DRAFT_498932 [Immersiella caudata]